MTCPSKLAKNLCLVLSLLAASTACGAPPAGAHHPTRLIVKLRDPAVTATGELRITRVGSLPVIKAFRRQPELVVVQADRPLAEAMALLRAEPNAVYVEPDYWVRATEAPNDPFFSTLWGMENTGSVINGDPGTAGADARATAAWDFWQGAQDFRIAVIDTGVDYTHADLVDNMWTNDGEIPGNGVDDDKNGYIDDVHGYNVIGGPGADPMDDHGHGTHVAGTIGATGDNGIGVTGVNWRCRVVPIKFLDSFGTGLTSDAITAIEYALDNGIRISNHSWGCYSCYSQALRDIIDIARSQGHLVVAASGNGILGVSTNTDDFPNYPSGYDLPNIIAVAASDQKDRKAVFSNDGRISVDLAAPGVNIYSTHLTGEYLFRSGTSMATPMVSGALALTWSRMPQLHWTQLRDRVFLTARPAPSFIGKTSTEGILDIAALVADCNHNGVLDDLEISGGSLNDCNGNLLLDVCERDCNANGLADECDLINATSVDCNHNDVPDECEPDCNGNSIADTCDVTDAFSQDCNTNLIPDECEIGNDADCDANQQSDLCDIASGIGADCNGNGALDQCDIDTEKTEDCTGNGIPDECEPDCNSNSVADSCDIDRGTSQDIDGNTIPDECAGFSLLPVTASGYHYISGNTIMVVRGEQRIVAEVYVSGWDPGRDGEPALRLYQATFNIGLDPPFSFAELPCTHNEDCIGDSLCVDGVCDEWGALNVDTGRPEYVFYNLDTIALSAVAGPFPTVFALLIDSVESVSDDGEPRYGGTMVLDLEPEAIGEFDIVFKENECFLESSLGELIAIPGFHPLRLAIQEGYDLRDGADLQNCLSMNGGTPDCSHLNAHPDDLLDYKDVRAFAALMSGPQ
jgi:hypothetical protein